MRMKRSAEFVDEAISMRENDFFFEFWKETNPEKMKSNQRKIETTKLECMRKIEGENFENFRKTREFSENKFNADLSQNLAYSFRWLNQIEKKNIVFHNFQDYEPALILILLSCK